MVLDAEQTSKTVISFSIHLSCFQKQFSAHAHPINRMDMFFYLHLFLFSAITLSSHAHAWHTLLLQSEKGGARSQVTGCSSRNKPNNSCVHYERTFRPVMSLRLLASNATIFKARKAKKTYTKQTKNLVFKHTRNFLGSWLNSHGLLSQSVSDFWRSTSGLYKLVHWRIDAVRLKEEPKEGLGNWPQNLQTFQYLNKKKYF